MIVWIIALSVFCLLAGPEPAYAWGPVTHIGLARTVLDHLDLVPGAVAALLGRHALAYCYGNIAADIVFAKRLSRVKQFCHHWSTGLRLLSSAKDDRAKAFAYGYVSHLAADTVAHGKYVPRQIVLSDCTVGVGHVYWELRADALADPAEVELLDCVLARDHRTHHVTLADHITDTFLSYDLNRLLFEGISAVIADRRFRRTVDRWARYSRWELSPDLLSGYRAECLDRTLSILREGERSALLREDPNGTSALMRLRVHRRDLRRRRRRGLPTKHRVLETSHSLSPERVFENPLSEPRP